MSRPKPKVVKTLTDENGIVWDVITTQNQYTVLYQGQSFSLRKEYGFSSQGFKYLKSTYPNEGSARAQANRLNKRFNCLDFTYVKSA